MATFRLHRGWRDHNGLVTDPITSSQLITANSPSDAITLALADSAFLLSDAANLAWLTDERGTLVWSLRLDDENIVPSH